MMTIATVRSPFTETAQIPKGPDAKHDAEGVIEVDQAFEAGLQDIEGFSHLYVLWHFHRPFGICDVSVNGDRTVAIVIIRRPRLSEARSPMRTRIQGCDGTPGCSSRSV